MDNKMKKRILLIGLSLSLLTLKNCDYIYTPYYEVLDLEDDAFAQYSLGKIYIGDECFLSGIKCSSNDVLVLDERDGEDPNMKIYGSCYIHNKDIRNEILEVLCRYEECYPSRWNRSVESMRLEWFMHNMSYSFQHEKDRTSDVDLNNKDESNYDSEVLSKFLGL